LAKLPPYLFAEIDAAVAAARAAGQDVVDLGVGDPDRPTPAPLVEIMSRAVGQARHHRYPPYQGKRDLRRTLAAWLASHHGIQVDPERHLLILLGSKEGLAHLPWALLEEGEKALVPDPGYPVYAEATLLAGGVPVSYPLIAANQFNPHLADLAGLCRAGTKILFLNFPNNPTGAVTTAEFFREVVSFARQRGFAVVNDAAYLEVILDGSPQPSLLSVADIEKDRVIEFHSLSKTFNMTGWRIGFAVGHEELIRDLGRVKKSIDSGVFAATQEVAAFAFGPQFKMLVDQVLAVYPRRREVLHQALSQAGIEVFPSRATFYLWSRVPDPGDSVSFCRHVLEKCGVVLTPGLGFGAGGEGWFRISLTAPEERISLAAERLVKL
jgi:LL-diaminopimelate aminotransferase